MKLDAEKFTVLTGRAIDALGGLVFLKMLSSLVDKGNVGQYMLFASMLALVLTMSYSALDQGLLRHVAEYRTQNSLGPRLSALIFAYLASALGGAGVLGAVLLGTGLSQAALAFVALLAGWLACDAVKNLNMTLASGLRSRGLIAAASAVDYAVRIGLLWVAHGDGAVTVREILELMVVASLAATGVFLWGHRRLLAPFSWLQVVDSLRDSIRFAWPMIVWGLFAWLQNMANRWLLEHFTDLETVAEYAVLVSVGTFPVTVMVGLVATYLVPILYERESRRAGAARVEVRRVAASLTPFAAALVVIVAMSHRELTILLTRETYASHSYIVPIVMTAACISAIATVLSYAVFAQRRVVSLLLPNALPGVFSMIFGFIAVHKWGLQGAVLTLVLSHLLAAALFVYAFARAAHEVPM